MVEDKNPPQDVVEISSRVISQSVSYDKDVVEIKLPDTVDSDRYGCNFVKDVCVDEVALFHQKFSEEKPVDKKPSPYFYSEMINSNSDIRYETKEDATKYIQELKPEVVVPVDSFPDCNNEKQYSSGKQCDPEDRITTGSIAGDPSDKKISLQELLRLESAEESRQAGIIDSEGIGKHKGRLHEEAAGQAYINDCHGYQAIATETSEHASSGVSSKDNTTGCLAMMSEGHDAADILDVRETSKIDRHNPSVDHRSLVVEDKSEPDCSIPAITEIPAITDDVCTEPISTVDSFGNVVTGSTGLDEVKIGGSGVDAASSSSSDIQPSEKIQDRSETLSTKPIAGVVDEDTAATSSSTNNVEPGGADGEDKEKCSSGGAAYVHDSDQIDEESCINTDDAVHQSCIHARDDIVVERTAPESSTSASHARSGDPFEPGFFGPSIISDPVSMSGHMAYSGNISLRSDSSTTSTRSFAFPVLQREWVSSPVRMAKAERRRARRHLGWRKGLICCKF